MPGHKSPKDFMLYNKSTSGSRTYEMAMKGERMLKLADRRLEVAARSRT
jgi:hypothetical protein